MDLGSWERCEGRETGEGVEQELPEGGGSCSEWGVENGAGGENERVEGSAGETEFIEGAMGNIKVSTMSRILDHQSSAE